VQKVAELAVARENAILTAATHDPLDQIRFKAGQASGVRLVLDMLKNVTRNRNG
jgi:hypothetical protein